MKLYVDGLKLPCKGTYTACISVNTFTTVKNSHPCLVMQEFQNEHQRNFSRLAKTSRTMQTAKSMVETKSTERHTTKQATGNNIQLSRI